MSKNIKIRSRLPCVMTKYLFAQTIPDKISGIKQINLLKWKELKNVDIYLSIYFLNVINPFSTNFSFLYPLKTSKNFRFSGGIEVEHWLKLG